MPKKKEIVRVSARAPRFREDTALMRAHETMVDLIKGTSGSFMDLLGAGIFDFIKDLEVDPDRDLIYSDEEDGNFNQQIQTQKPLQPHPQIKELDDEEADKQIKESIEEEKRKSKANKNKRKKMRKKEKKRLEKDNVDKKVLPGEEQEKSDSSESEELKEDDNNKELIKKELIKSTTNLSEKFQTEAKSNTITKEEKPAQLNKKKDDSPKKLNPKKSTPCITESVPDQKPKSKPEKLEKTQKKEEVEVKQTKKENPKMDQKNALEIQKEKQDDTKEEMVDSIVEEYAKRSREIAAIGNRMAATGQYEMAIKCFTDAIKFNPKEYKLFGNRSFCFERLHQYENALSDAEVSLSMEPTWTKGLFRKGKALCGLKKYYDASLVFKEVLRLESMSQEAAMELKRAQTLHLMEMGFTWSQSSNALKSYPTLEEAIEALFMGHCGPSLRENGACKLDVPEQSSAVQSGYYDEGEWERVRQSTRPRTQQQTRDMIEHPAPFPRSQAKPDLFPVWVGSLASTVTYATLYDLFNRAGKVFSIKMVLEHDCAFVNYTRKEDCDRAIQTINGMVLEGCPLSVRYPSRIPPGIGVSKNAMTDPLTPLGPQKKECFFWRTIGCTRDDCTFKHVPEHRGIDREKYSGKVNHNHF